MILNVIGVEEVNYTNKDNKQVTGTKIHCTYEKRNVDGQAVEEIYFSTKKASEIRLPIVSVGDSIDVMYNKYGSIDLVKLV